MSVIETSIGGALRAWHTSQHNKHNNFQLPKIKKNRTHIFEVRIEVETNFQQLNNKIFLDFGAHTESEWKKNAVKARQTDDRRGQQQGKLEMEAEKSKKRRYKHRVARATAGSAGLHIWQKSGAHQSYRTIDKIVINIYCFYICCRCKSSILNNYFSVENYCP